MLEWLRKTLDKRRVTAIGPDRRVRYSEEMPSERFVLIIALMIVFFIGLIVLEIAHMLLLGSWNDTVLDGIMLIVGTIIGAVFGYTEA